MIDVFAICGAGICLVFAIAVIREIRREYTFVLVLCALVLVGIAHLPTLRESVAFLRDTAKYTDGETVGCLLRALGITYLTGTAAEICRSVGEGNVGNYIEMAGRAEITVLCIPLFRELLDLALL